jgi:hypothetical protein
MMTSSALPASTAHRGTVAIPEAFGTAIPSNPAELMKFLQLQKQLKASLSTADVRRLPSAQHLSTTLTAHPQQQSLSTERLKKQEMDRETYENKLMQLEDYVFRLEGVERLKRIEDGLKMYVGGLIVVQVCTD